MEDKLQSLATFSNYANDKNVFVCDLVKMGFIYLGHNDALKCTGCKKVFSDWRNVQDLVKQHRMVAPDCVFASPSNDAKTAYDKMLEVSKSNNMQKSTTKTTTEFAGPAEYIKKVKYPSYKNLDDRIQSFKEAPKILIVCCVKAAKAGFFYSGYSDHVGCFCCGGTLGEWREGEDPWEEHQKWFPDCQYLQHHPKTNSENTDQAISSYQTDTGTLEAASENIQTEVEKNLDVTSLKNGIPQTTEEMISSTEMLAVLEMGYSVDTVKSAIEIWKTCSKDARPSSIHIVNIILNNEEIESHPQIQPPDEVSQNQAEAQKSRSQSLSVLQEQANQEERNSMASDHFADPKSAAHKTDTSKRSQRGTNSRETNSSGISPKAPRGHLERVSRDSTSVSSTETSQKDDQEPSNGPENKFVKKPYSSCTTDYHSIQREVQKLQDLTLCKVCMDANIDIVFMPCGHIVTCSTCSKTIKKCPLCRQKVKGTAKAYLS